MVEDDIRITDLAAPVYSELEKQVIGSAKPVTMSEEAVLGAAQDAAGLTDFGPEDFRERLHVWLQSFDEDRGLNALGRSMVFDSMVRYAKNRLKIEDLLKRHPEILQIELPNPIIVSGLPRSGTTHLVNILASHPELRAMELWETNEPVPQPDEMIFESTPENPRYQRSNAIWYLMNEVLKYWPAMHDWAPGHVHEEVELQCFDFSSYMPDWQARVPRWQQYYADHDQTLHYQYARKVVQMMTWFKGPNRWVMKSPQNMENLKPLLATYPDATVVLTHRDPVAVLQSAITMMAYLDRLRRDPADLDLPGLAEYWINRIERLLRACVRDRDRLPPGQVIDVMFHEYMADETGIVEQVCVAAALPLTAAARTAFAAYLVANPRGKHGRIRYDLHGDFGVDIAALRRRFQFYYDRFPVKKEPVNGD